MVPALSAIERTAASPVRRLGFTYLPNGQAMALNRTSGEMADYWTPKGEGRDFELSMILSPLESFKDRLVVVTGLEHGQAEALGDGAGEHSRASATWLNGVHPKKTEGADVRGAKSADQYAVDKLGADTALPSIEVAATHVDTLMGQCEQGYTCRYTNSVAWRNETTPLPTMNNPRTIFERLFGDGGSTEQRVARLRKNRSILDWLRSDIARLQGSLGPTDRANVDQYLDSVREVERRIQRAEQQSSESALPASMESPLGIPETYSEHVAIIYDLLAVAYQADITRVFTFLMGREQNPRGFPEIDIPDSHHGLSHHGGRAESILRYAKCNVLQAQLFAKFLEKLQATPDGDGSVLDHTLLLYGGGLSDADRHSHFHLPLLLAGGASGQLKGGRHLVYPEKTPMTNLLLSMLEKADVPLEKLGDSTGRLDLLSGL
jgi:hypothetical protein